MSWSKHRWVTSMGVLRSVGLVSRARDAPVHCRSVPSVSIVIRSHFMDFIVRTLGFASVDFILVSGLMNKSVNKNANAWRKSFEPRPNFIRPCGSEFRKRQRPYYFEGNEHVAEARMRFCFGSVTRLECILFVRQCMIKRNI